jgi:hypothetical protein
MEGVKELDQFFAKREKIAQGKTREELIDRVVELEAAVDAMQTLIAQGEGHIDATFLRAASETFYDIWGEWDDI